MNVINKILSTLGVVIVSALLPFTAVTESEASQRSSSYSQETSLQASSAEYEEQDGDDLLE